MGPSKGPWNLRFLIIKRDIDSHLFLTGHGGINEVVKIAPKGADWQQVRKFNISVNCMINLVTVPQWLVYPIEGKEDWYRIVPDPEGIFPRNLAPKDDSDDVIIASPHYEWRLQYIPINLAGGDVYQLVFLLAFSLSAELTCFERIHAKELIGAELLLGKDKMSYEVGLRSWRS